VAGQDHAAFGALLRRLRADAGLTQEQLAEAAGVSTRAISALERGINKTARRETARLLASALGLAGQAREAFEAAAAGRAPGSIPGGRAAQTLPRDIASFTGRDIELAALDGAVTATAARGGIVGICAIGGMAGIGKTALAVHAAHRLAAQFPDGQLFVPLHGHTPGLRPASPADALAGLLQATGATAAQIPAGLDARAAAWRDRMAGRRMLLVLDDAVGSGQVRPLLPGASGCLVLVTSRRRLTALDDAATISLDTLPPGETALLITRLAGRPGLDPADPAVAQIAAMCGHLPLAVGMLARQLHHHPAWSPAHLAAELSAARDRLDLMRAEDQAVAAAFALSYADLTGSQQRLFRLLGLHPGGDADAYAAAALAGTGLADARRDLQGLYDQHLITEPAPGRYRFHDLIREHARGLAARSADGEDGEPAMRRLLNYYEYAAALADARLTRKARLGPPPAAPAGLAGVPAVDDTARALAWVRAERASLLACLDYVTRAGQHARVAALTAGLAELLRNDGPLADAITRHAAAVESARCLGEPVAEARALDNLAIVRQLAGDYPAAARDFQAALDISRRSCSRLGEANALHGLGDVRRQTGDYPGAAAAVEQALAIYRDLGSRLGEANALHCLAGVFALASDYPAAVAANLRSLVIYRDLGEQFGEAAALNYLGDVLRVTGDYPGAVGVLEQALVIHRDLGHRNGEGNALFALGGVQRRAGAYPAAARNLGQALVIFRELDNRLGEANTLNGLGTLQRLAGDHPAAAQALDQALRIYRDLGDRGGEAEALNERGALHQISGELADARRCHQRALDLARAIASSWDEAHSLAGIARCARAAGDAPQAAALLRQAGDVFARIGAPEAAAVHAELAALAAPAAPGGPACDRG
jgi:tetratricopeptide (TPR) repeat protein/transcriptional regulator with XRE-family HTH domain